MQVTQVLRALPLTLVFVAGCNINIGNISGEGEGECEDLGDICPNLSCENGNKEDDDGCPICECEEDIGECTEEQAGPAPECANARLDLEDCRWVCGNDSCESDADCGFGSVCVIFEECAASEERPDDGAPDEAPAPPVCEIKGECVALPTDCFSDSDCGPGFRCDFSGAEPGDPDQPNDGGGGDGGAEPPPDEEGDRADPIPAPGGQCVPVEEGCQSDADCPRGFFCAFVGEDAGGLIAAPEAGGVCLEQQEQQCFSDFDCREGQHCEFATADDNGLVAESGVCVDDVIECRSDEDCAPGQRCTETCQQDPNCPECDVCFLVSTCEETFVPCGSDFECRDGEVCSIDGGAGFRRPCIDENGDGLCDDQQDPVPSGVCIPAPPADCQSDLDCAPGEQCQLIDECVCDASCEIDPSNPDVCLPCECPEPAQRGVCVEAAVFCFSDEECRDDEFCQLENGFAPPPPECDPATGENCGACDPNSPDCAERPAPPPQGTCQPLEGDACALVDCREGTHCEVDAAGNVACVEDAPRTSCSSDEQCAATNQVCNAADLCLPNPDCVEGEACDDGCYGFCV